VLVALACLTMTWAETLVEVPPNVEIESRTVRLASQLVDLDLNDSSIIGGDNAAEGEYPFAAALFTKADARHGSRAICTGSLITPFYILTAAHCIGGWDGVQVGSHAYIGRTDLDLFPDGVTSVRAIVTRIVVHPKFVDYYHGHDIALLRLRYPVGLQPVQIETSSSLTMENQMKNIIAIGYGETESGAGARYLQEIVQPLYPVCDCYSIDNAEYFSDRVASRQVCYYPPTRYHRVCFGDSGGPMISGSSWNTFKVRGVVSFGTGCNQRLPDFYTRVSAYAGWISSHVGSLRSRGSPSTAAVLGVTTEAWKAYDPLTAAHLVCRSKGYGTGMRLKFSPDANPIGVACFAASVVSFFNATDGQLNRISLRNRRFAVSSLAGNRGCSNGFLTGEAIKVGSTVVSRVIACVIRSLDTFQVKVDKRHLSSGYSNDYDRAGILFAKTTGFRVGLWNPAKSTWSHATYTFLGTAFNWSYLDVDNATDSVIEQDCYPNCPISCPSRLRGNGECNSACNYAVCGYDAGDCA